jgi:hypothetical protein
MRIRLIHKLAIASIDGIQLQHFEPGKSYDVGVTVGTLLLAEGWAEPDDGRPARAEDASAHNTTKILRLGRSLAEGIAADSARRNRQD